MDSPTVKTLSTKTSHFHSKTSRSQCLQESVGAPRSPTYKKLKDCVDRQRSDEGRDDSDGKALWEGRKLHRQQREREREREREGDNWVEDKLMSTISTLYALFFPGG